MEDVGQILAICGIPLVAANLLIWQEFIFWIRGKKLVNISLLTVLLCSGAGLAYGLHMPAIMNPVFSFSLLPPIRVILATRMKTPLGYWLILVPASVVSYAMCKAAFKQ